MPAIKYVRNSVGFFNRFYFLNDVKIKFVGKFSWI